MLLHRFHHFLLSLSLRRFGQPPIVDYTRTVVIRRYPHATTERGVRIAKKFGPLSLDARCNGHIFQAILLQLRNLLRYCLIRTHFESKRWLKNGIHSLLSSSRFMKQEQQWRTLLAHIFFFQKSRFFCVKGIYFVVRICNKWGRSW